MTTSSLYWHPSESKLKNSAISSNAKTLQNLLGKKRSLIRTEFENEALGGAKAARSLSRISDRIILDHTLPLTDLFKNDDKNWAICATSTYGTGYLAPFDPLNLLLIYKGAPSPKLEKQFEELLYLLWIAGFRLSAEIVQCEKASSEINSSELPKNMRFLFGEKEILAEFRKKNHHLFQEQCNAIIERRLKSLYAQNDIISYHPDLTHDHSPIHSILEFDYILTFFRENKQSGTLGKQSDGESYPLSILIENKILLPKEITVLRFIWRFLWTICFHQHYLTNQAQNSLTPFLQPLIAAKMKYTGTRSENYQDQFMRHYFLAIRNLERLERTVDPICFANIAPASAIANKLFISSSEHNHFIENPIKMLRLLEKASITRKPLHPEGISLLIRSSHQLHTLIGNPEASRILLNLIRQSPLFLGQHFLNNTGILNAMIPSWQHFFCITRISSTTGRSYLLDQDCLNVVNVLALLENGLCQQKAPLASRLFKTISEWKALYLAALLQHIGETTESDSYVESASIARNIAQQFGLSEAEQESVYWLILHREILHESIYKKENAQHKMRVLAAKIQSPNRLKLIYLLTIADIMSSRNDLSANWDESLLQQTYFRLCNRLRGNLTPKDQDVLNMKEKKQNIAYHLRHHDHQAILEKYLSIESNTYWSKFSFEEQIEHFNLFKDFFSHDSTLKYHIKISKQETIISIVLPDIPGNMSYLTKRLNEIQVNIKYAEFYALSSIGASLFVLHSPWYGGIITNMEENMENLTILLKFAFNEDAKNLKEIIKNNTFPNSEKHAVLPRKERILSPARIYFDHHFSENALFIEINGRDSKGCLNRICTILAKYKIIIKQAHIRTYGVRITNIFHVTDPHHQKLTDPKILASLQEDLIHILNRDFDHY